MTEMMSSRLQNPSLLEMRLSLNRSDPNLIINRMTDDKSYIKNAIDRRILTSYSVRNQLVRTFLPFFLTPRFELDYKNHIYAKFPDPSWHYFMEPGGLGILEYGSEPLSTGGQKYTIDKIFKNWQYRNFPW